jgi:hypothetical protein
MEEVKPEVDEVERVEPCVERPVDGDAAAIEGEPTNPPIPGKPGVDPGGEGDGDAAAIEGELDELVRTAAQRDEYLALAQRTQADFENYRKRVARDAAQAQERGVAKLAKELLPALDNLDRAIEAAPWMALPIEGAPQRAQAGRQARPRTRCSRGCAWFARRSPPRSRA